jgi:hypothetical protein
MNPHAGRRAVWLCYAASGVSIALGAWLAARAGPQPFDWTRTVISALASRKHNPEGSLWFAGALGIGFALLWPVAAAVSSARGANRRVARWTAVLLRAGLLCGMFVAAERIVFFHFSDRIHKGHEALAVVAFLALYLGELALEIDHVRRRTSGPWMAAAVLFPLVAVALLLLTLYLSQRHLGWIDHDWSGSEPIWGRFPFWQWIATAALWAGFGHLLFLAGKSRPPS